MSLETKLTYENLYAFQKKIYDRFKDQDNAALLMDMGTGKTPTTISLIRYKYGMVGGVVPTVIFCPVITLQNWKDELTTWTKLDPEYIGIVKGTSKKRLAVIEDEKHKIIILNYEALRSDAVVKALIKRKFKIAVCDESQRIKTYKSIACRKVLQVTKEANVFRSILSGTPITNSVVDIWSQYLFLDHGKTFGNRLTVFRNRYMVNHNADWQNSGSKKAFPDWQFNETTKKEFKQKLKDTSARIKTEDAVDLPELTTKRIDIELSKEQKKHYEQVRKDLITWLDESEENPLVVKNALTKLLRLNEISSGYMRLYDGTIHKFKDNPRLDACIDLIESATPHKVIVYCIFQENYKDLRNALDKKGIDYLEITGEKNTDEKLEAAKLFQDTEKGPRVCIANTRAAGLGVNLVGARYKIYFTRSYSLDDYLQSQKRNNRAGAIKFHSKIFDYHLVAPQTIDEVIYNRLIQKKKFSTSLLDIKKLLT
jgi:SNF2 family DNA or RNA helicase